MIAGRAEMDTLQGENVDTGKTMIRLTDQMRDLLKSAISDGTPCIVGTASKDGRPQVSPKGSVAVYDDEHLCFWERSFRSSYAQISENPQIVIYYRNAARAPEMPYLGGAIRFHGVGRIIKEGPERDRAWALTPIEERNRDPDGKGCAVLVRVDRVEELSGKTIMQRD